VLTPLSLCVCVVFAVSDWVIEVVTKLTDLCRSEGELEPLSQLSLALAHVMYGNSALAMIVAAVDFDPAAVSAKVKGDSASATRVRASMADVAAIIAAERA
jgi:hypothetical protein